MEIVSNRRLFIDGYFLSQIPLIMGMVQAIEKQKDAVYYFAAGFVWLSLTVKFSKATVHNLSNLNVICKDENSEEIAVCPPGHSGVGIDGFKVKGKVWKLIDGNDAYVMPNGNVTYSLGLGTILNILKGTEPPKDQRQGWGKLYNAKEEDL